MTCVSRRAVVPLAAVLVGTILTGCSAGSSGSAGAVGAGSAPAFVGVQTSNLFVTLENLAAQPLLDVRVTIQPYGTMPGFTQSITRLESSEKRDISLGAFRSNDGTPFNQRFARPREVLVTAVDLNGKKFETAVAWKN